LPTFCRAPVSALNSADLPALGLLQVRLYRDGRSLCPTQRDRHPADAAGDRISAHRPMMQQLD
jgi:hypothetical protein